MMKKIIIGLIIIVGLLSGCTQFSNVDQTNPSQLTNSNQISSSDAKNIALIWVTDQFRTFYKGSAVSEWDKTVINTRLDNKEWIVELKLTWTRVCDPASEVGCDLPKDKYLEVRINSYTGKVLTTYNEFYKAVFNR